MNRISRTPFRFNLAPAIRFKQFLALLLAAGIFGCALPALVPFAELPVVPSSSIAFAGSGVDCPAGPDDPCVEDNTKTAGVIVKHHYEDYPSRLVEPDDSDTWLITATWKTQSGIAVCPCDSEIVAATVTVDWDGTDWTATCTGCNATSGPIYKVKACGTADCGTRSSEYVLLVDIEELNTDMCDDAWLWTVDFLSTELDDGNYFTTSPSSTVTAVSPVNEPYSTTDTQIFDCEFGCLNFSIDAELPEVEIEYAP